jgi:hypothetical protein
MCAPCLTALVGPCSNLDVLFDHGTVFQAFPLLINVSPSCHFRILLLPWAAFSIYMPLQQRSASMPGLQAPTYLLYV